MTLRPWPPPSPVEPAMSALATFALPPSVGTEIRIQIVSPRFFRNLLAIAKGNT